jgi:hypothetical protein
MPTTIMNRRELLDLVWGRHRDGVQDSSEIQRAAQAGQEMTVIWREEDVSPGGTLPRVITMPSEAHREFLAWAYTYLAVLRPFTAFIRLLDPAKASEFLQRSRVQDLGRLREAFVALIIGESASHLGLRPEFLQQLTPNACANSHSYALARAVVLGFEQQVEVSPRPDKAAGAQSARLKDGLSGSVRMPGTPVHAKHFDAPGNASLSTGLPGDCRRGRH